MICLPVIVTGCFSMALTQNWAAELDYAEAVASNGYGGDAASPAIWAVHTKYFLLLPLAIAADYFTWPLQVCLLFGHHHNY